MDELVNIPALLIFSDGGTEFEISSVLMVCTSLALRSQLGKSGCTRSRSRRKDFPSGWSNLGGRISQKNL